MPIDVGVGKGRQVRGGCGLGFDCHFSVSWGASSSGTEMKWRSGFSVTPLSGKFGGAFGGEEFGGRGKRKKGRVEKVSRVSMQR